MSEAPLLWYVNRGTGIVLIALLTIVSALGVWSLRARAGGRVPGFVVQSLHRNLALVSAALLGTHVASAIADEYVDIRWWQAVVPVGATYEPLWLGLGTLSLDLLAAVTITSLLRSRLDHRVWRLVHLLSWLAWLAAATHSVGIGTDLSDPGGLAVLPAVACVVAVLLALAVRVTHTLRSERPAAWERSS